MSDKIFETATLTCFYDNNDLLPRIGEFSWRDMSDGLPPKVMTRTAVVLAWTKAWVVEKLNLCFIEQGVTVTNGGLGQLPLDHRYAQPPEAVVVRGVVNSAAIIHRIVADAQAWKNQMADYLPPAMLEHLPLFEDGDKITVLDKDGA